MFRTTVVPWNDSTKTSSSKYTRKSSGAGAGIRVTVDDRIRSQIALMIVDRACAPVVL